MTTNMSAYFGLVIPELSRDLANQHIPAKGGEDGGHHQLGLRELGFKVWLYGKENTA
jgi:hypothetical protein